MTERPRCPHCLQEMPPDFEPPGDTESDEQPTGHVMTLESLFEP
jgi:hypothetical protein